MNANEVISRRDPIGERLRILSGIAFGMEGVEQPDHGRLGQVRLLDKPRDGGRFQIVQRR